MRIQSPLSPACGVRIWSFVDQLGLVQRIDSRHSGTATVPEGAWVTGGDWDHSLWGGELPTREWIDAVTPDALQYLLAGATLVGAAVLTAIGGWVPLTATAAQSALLVARGAGGVSSPVKMFLNGTMPALTNISVGSLYGTSGAEAAMMAFSSAKFFGCFGSLIFNSCSLGLEFSTSMLSHYESGAKAIDKTDGISLEFDDWRFNLRMSNTEPVVRLNVESRGNKQLVEQKTAEVLHLLNS